MEKIDIIVNKNDVLDKNQVSTHAKNVSKLNEVGESDIFKEHKKLKRNLKKEYLHAQEEVKRIQTVPLVIDHFLEGVDQNIDIVGSTTGNEGRGAFIVLEGIDRAGKTTQATKLVEILEKNNVPTKKYSFPNRASSTGRKIDDYLKGLLETENMPSDEEIHILFSENRKELVPTMNYLINKGVTLIVDRYSFSGVAFSIAKPNMNEDWCWEQERGLPKPDLVLFLHLPLDKACKRHGYGNERYEDYNFQKKVFKNYEKMMDSSWQIIRADKDIETVNQEIMKHVQRVISEVRYKPLSIFQ